MMFGVAEGKEEKKKQQQQHNKKSHEHRQHEEIHPRVDFREEEQLSPGAQTD